MKKSLSVYFSAFLLILVIIVGVTVIPKVLAKPTEEPPHTHTYSTFVKYDVENNKAYEIKKCSCNETSKTEIANSVAVTTQTAQTALDNAAEGSVIVLDEGNYGNLYIRKNAASEEIENSTWAGGAPNTTFKRTIKNVTILGTEGAVVSSIVGEAATYANTPHSLAEEHKYLDTYLDIENLTIKNIVFTPAENKVAVSLAGAGHKVSIDGCTVNGSGSITSGNMLFNSDSQTATVYTKNSETVLTAYRKNITITNNVLNSLHLGVKMNYVENITISNNTFNQIKGRDMLLGGGNGDIAGNIEISNNTSDGATERFARIAVLSGNLNVTNNVVTNNNGADTDIVKVTYKSGATPTVNFTGNSWEGLSDAEAKLAGVLNCPD